MAGLAPTAPATDAVHWVGPLVPLWLSGGGPAAVPPAHLCIGGSDRVCCGGASGGGVSRPGEPAVVDDGFARFPSTAHVPTVVYRSLVCGTGVVVEARTGAVGIPTGGRPRAATHFCRWVYSSPAADLLAAWELPTGGSVADEASEAAAAAMSGGADGAVDGGPVRALIPWVTSAFSLWPRLVGTLRCDAGLCTSNLWGGTAGPLLTR